jgi:hypothetical protein
MEEGCAHGADWAPRSEADSWQQELAWLRIRWDNCRECSSGPAGECLLPLRWPRLNRIRWANTSPPLAITPRPTDPSTLGTGNRPPAPVFCPVLPDARQARQSASSVQRRPGPALPRPSISPHCDSEGQNGRGMTRPHRFWPDHTMVFSKVLRNESFPRNFKDSSSMAHDRTRLPA